MLTPPYMDVKPKIPEKADLAVDFDGPAESKLCLGYEHSYTVL